MKISMLCCYLFSIFPFCLIAQEIQYSYPRNMDNYRGDVQQVFLYEYKFFLNDTTRFSPNLTKELNPSYSYHFDEKKCLNSMFSYKEKERSVAHYFIHNEDKNLLYKIRLTGLALPPKDLKSWKKLDLDSLLKQSYTYLKAPQRILNTSGLSLQQYHYDMENLTLLIDSDIGIPPNRIKFDLEKRVVEIEAYHYERNRLKFAKTINTYEANQLKKISLSNPDQTTTKTFSYDSLNRVSVKKMICSNPRVMNRVSHYQYPKNGVCIIKDYNEEGELLSSIKKTIVNPGAFYQKDIGAIKDNYDMYEINFKDKVGNIIKRYKINPKSKIVQVKEYHFSYYK